MTIQQIRLIHTAFEQKPNHIATYLPLNDKTVLENLEDLYSRTQNIEESWIKDARNFTVIPVINQRSTSVGDIMVVCYDNPKGNGYNEVWYKVDNSGFSKWFEKGHVSNNHLRKKV